MDFAIGLVNSVINLRDGQVKFFEEFKLLKNCEINLLIKTFLGLVEMMFGLINVSFEWQALKMTLHPDGRHGNPSMPEILTVLVNVKVRPTDSPPSLCKAK